MHPTLLKSTKIELRHCFATLNFTVIVVSDLLYLIGGDTTNIRSLYPVLGTVSPNDNRHGNAFYNTNRSRKASGESGLDLSSESLKHGCPMDCQKSVSQ